MTRLRFDPWSGHIQEATSDWEEKTNFYNKTRLSKKERKELYQSVGSGRKTGKGKTNVDVSGGPGD